VSVGLRVGQVAEAVGVNVETLRYYERRGIIAEPERSLGGHRLYPEATVTTLRVIKAAQNLRFSLDEVSQLLRRADTTTAPAVASRPAPRTSSSK
jgi:DNA-binding transcriptional MerR regulator